MNPAMEQKFTAYLQDQMGKPFEWGVNDCNTFVLNLLDHMLDTDLAKQVVGQYHDERSAYRFAKKIGFLKDYIKDYVVPVERNHAQTGDIILYTDKAWDAGHICIGNKTIAPDRELGVTHLEMPDGDVYRWSQC